LVNPGIIQDVLDELRVKGHTIKETEKEIGAPALILIDHEIGKFYAATDLKNEHFTEKIP
jgi:gamma-glutamyltranspeptidase